MDEMVETHKGQCLTGAGKWGWGSTSHLALKEKMEEIFIETEERVLWRVPANWSYILGSFDIAST